MALRQARLGTNRKMRVPNSREDNNNNHEPPTDTGLFGPVTDFSRTAIGMLLIPDNGHTPIRLIDSSNDRYLSCCARSLLTDLTSAVLKT